MLVGDVADDLLDDVLDRNQPVGAAIFVDHQRQMGVRGLHLQQQFQHGHGGRREQDIVLDPGDRHFAQTEIPVAFGFQKFEHALQMHEADGVVERLAIDRQARMLRLAEQQDEIGQRGLFLHRDDVGARHHHVLDLQLAELEQIGEHDAFLRRQRRALAVAFLDHLLQAFADRGRRIVAAQQMRQALQKRRRLFVFVVEDGAVGVAHGRQATSRR